MRLDHRITLQRATRAKDASGYNSDLLTWADLLTIYAARADVSAGERYRASEIGGQITRRFTVRWNSITSTLTPADRLLFDARPHNIVYVREIVRNQYLEINCVEQPDVEPASG